MDIFCSMLFEASGDSEIDGVDDATVFEEDDDDAQSCSYGSLDWECVNKKMNEKDNFDRRVEVFCLDDDDDDDEEEEEDVVEQCYCGGYRAAEVVDPPRTRPLSNASEESVVAEKFKKSKVCDNDPNMKTMNQRDRDKLFWEACLAS